MQRVFLINPMTIKDLTNISVNMSDKMLDVAIKEAQDTELNEILGTKLLYKLYDLVGTGQISQTENSLYKELLDYHVSYFLTYNAISRLIVIASIKIDNIGVVTTGDEKVNNLPVKDIFALESYYRGKSDFYKSRLQAYLRLHRDEFMELQYHDAYNTLAAIETAYTSSIFLGGRRGKQIHKPCYCKPTQPNKPVELHTINYYVDNVIFTSAKYATGQLIKHIEAPLKENQHFNVWLYEKDGAWHNLPDYMPDFDINAYAHYIWEEGEQHTYQIGYKVAEGYSDADVDFGNMCYINEPFEWLQVVDKGYNPETREGWARLSHPSLRFDTAISCQKFFGYDKIETLDLHELNNVSLTDRMFSECKNLHNFIAPKGLVGMLGYDFYGSNLTYINFKTDYEYKPYEAYAYPMTGSFCFCPNLECIYADNQSNMYSDGGNLYNYSDELMAARYGEVTIKDGTTSIKSEAIKGRGLTTLTIPSSVRIIEGYAIAENYGLTDVDFGGTIEEWGRVEKGENIFQYCQVNVIHCTDGDCDVYYAGEEVAEHKIDVFIEWDYLETRWFKVGERIELPEPPVRDGYVFLEWGAIVSGGDWFTLPEFMPDYDFEVHASYSEIQPDEPERELYRVDLYADTEWLESNAYYEGDEIAYPVPPTFEGYEFSRWEVNNGNWEQAPTHMPNYSFNAIAKYTKIEPDYSTMYTTFEAMTDGVFSFTKRGTGDDIQYSKDNGTTWIPLASDENVSVVAGDKVMWKSTLTPSTSSSSSSYGIGRFATSCDFKVYGNIMSLAYGDDFIDKTDLTGKDYIFYELFNKCAKLTDASDLLLPATTLSKRCYRSMFCEASALTKAPELPATTLTEYCYSWMFYKCASLTTAPELPATTLKTQCYSYMFNGCTSLTIAPELPATTLVKYCYASMFNSCSKLKHITMLATDISASMCLDMWVGGITSTTGTFVKHPDMTTLPTGNSGIPNGWTVEDYVA